MTRAQAVAALIDRWVKEVGEDGARGIVFGFLLARADPTLGRLVEGGMDEMEDDTALANQAAREQYCKALRDWLRDEGVAV